jgi:hypothetical protein
MANSIRAIVVNFRIRRLFPVDFFQILAKGEAILAIGIILEFIILASLRMFYPFELEWIEGAYVDEARRAAQGVPLYGPPSIFFVPTSKTPVFFYLSAGLMRLFGDGFFAPRLVSILSTLGCFLLLFAIVRRESGRSFPGILAAGIYAASFRFAGAWMDLAKTDSLFLCLILAAFYAGQGAKERWKLLVSGLLFALAYFTKQLALPVVLALAPISLVVSRGRTWPRWVSAFVLGLVIFWGLDVASQGWFSFYTFDTVTRHTRLADFWLFWRIFLPKMWPALLLAILYTASVLLKTRPLQWEWPVRAWESLGLGGALVLASWSIFIKVWTYDNGLMPASAGIALLAGLGAAAVMDWPLHAPRQLAARENVGMYFQSGALICLLFQFALLFYNPFEQLPTRADRSATESFVRQVANLPGEVLVFNHGYVSSLAGKTTYLHSAPYGDVVGSAVPKGSDTYWRREAVLATVHQAISDQRFDWVILDKVGTGWLPYYIPVKDVSEDPDSFYPVTGAVTRPERLLVKNPVVRGGEFPLVQALFNPLFVHGWGEPGAGGRPALGNRSVVQVALEKQKYQIQIQVQPVCSESQPVIQAIQIGWNDRPLAGESFSSCESRSIAVEIPRNEVSKGLNDLWFAFETDSPGSEIDKNTSQDSPSAIFTSILIIQK